ncbi:MAG: hypothetical protein COV67_05190 [Nitrospinae bacterium CG11_big_fil_rev_8_21_14_0_20_56_8]|nr:MAG: hypothetical protein COV67_05190 [Nitrospinae bacterium CG11_big_fil_rev_8_21_14_0_20_56_8]
MFKIELHPQMRRELKDPDRFIKGMEISYWGMIITMFGVLVMLFLYFQIPEHVLHPTWILVIGFIIIGVGEYQKFKAR